MFLLTALLAKQVEISFYHIIMHIIHSCNACIEVRIESTCFHGATRWHRVIHTEPKMGDSRKMGRWHHLGLQRLQVFTLPWPSRRPSNGLHLRWSCNFDSIVFQGLLQEKAAPLSFWLHIWTLDWPGPEAAGPRYVSLCLSYIAF